MKNNKGEEVICIEDWQECNKCDKDNCSLKQFNKNYIAIIKEII